MFKLDLVSCLELLADYSSFDSLCLIAVGLV